MENQSYEIWVAGESKWRAVESSREVADDVALDIAVEELVEVEVRPTGAKP